MSNLQEDTEFQQAVARTPLCAMLIESSRALAQNGLFVQVWASKPRFEFGVPERPMRGLRWNMNLCAAARFFDVAVTDEMYELLKPFNSFEHVFLLVPAFSERVLDRAWLLAEQLSSDWGGLPLTGPLAVTMILTAVELGTDYSFAFPYGPTESFWFLESEHLVGPYDHAGAYKIARALVRRGKVPGWGRFPAHDGDTVVENALLLLAHLRGSSTKQLVEHQFGHSPIFDNDDPERVVRGKLKAARLDLTGR